ncbi:hypothetical protein D3C81_1614000 [compost metagenome]
MRSLPSPSGQAAQSPKAKMSSSRVVCRVGRTTNWLMRLLSRPSRSLRKIGARMPAAQTLRLAGMLSPWAVFRPSAVTSCTAAPVITVTPSFSRVRCTGALMRSGRAGSTRGPASIRVMRMFSGWMLSSP